MKQQGSVTLGLRVTIWPLSRWGVEGRVGYAPSRLWSNFPVFQTHIPYPAQLLTVSLKALLRLTPPAARTALHVGVGVGLVDHGGDAYPQWYSGPTTFYGGTANLGGAIRLTRWAGVRFDVEDFAYSAHLGPCTRTGPGSGSVCDVYGEQAGYSTGSRLQDDLVLTLGFALTISPRD